MTEENLYKLQLAEYWTFELLGNVFGEDYERVKKAHDLLNEILVEHSSANVGQRKDEDDER